MNKKIKRIGKTVLTFALVLTMLFGQLPSGLVLNSLAAPEETSEPSSENPGKGKDYSAGVSSIVDAPQDTSEVISEEDSEEEDESESAPETVSDDSNLTSEVNADSETVIKEETNSDSAQDENNQDENKQDENKEESSASEEAEVVSENPSEQISAEVSSENEEISESPSENTSDANEPEIKDASGEKKSIISGIVEPFRNFGFIFFDIDSEGFEEMLGEPEGDPIGIPTVTQNAGDFAGVYGEYNLADYFTIGYIEDTDKDFITVDYSVDDENEGTRTVKVTLSANEGYVFVEGENKKTQIEKEYPGFVIKKKSVQLTRITIDGSRPYEKGKKNLPVGSEVHFYNNEGIEIDNTIISRDPANDCFTLDSDSADDVNPKTVIFDSSKLIINPNYDVTIGTTVPESAVYVTRLEVSISFNNNKPQKQSGNIEITEADKNNFSYSVKKIDQSSVDVRVQLSDGVNFSFRDSKPANDIDIDIDVNPEQAFSFFDSDNTDVTSNYNITLALKGDIKPKPIGKDIDLTKYATNNVIISDDISISFDQDSFEESENVYWLNEKTGSELSSSDTDFYNYKSETNELDELATITLGEDTTDGSIGNIVFKKNAVYYGPISIKYKKDGSRPTIDASKVKVVPNKKKSITTYTITEEVIDASISSNNIADTKSGFIVLTEPIEETTSLEEYADDFVDESTLEGNPFKISDIDAKDKYIYVYTRDKAGNRRMALIDSDISQDINAPVISIAQESVDETIKQIVEQKIQPYNNKDYLTELKFKISVTDLSSDTSKSSGIKQVTLYTIDGIGKENHPAQLYGNPIVENLGKGITSWTSNLYSFDSQNYHGYELHFLIVAKDWKDNTAYAVAYWDSEGHMQCETTEFDNEEAAKYASVDEEKTFAILGTGNNKPNIKVQFTDSCTYKYNEDDDIYYYYGEKRTAEVSFENMVLETIRFDNQDSKLGGNKSDFSATGYDSTNHCYVYSSENWEFDKREKVYSVNWLDPDSDSPNNKDNALIDFSIAPENRNFVINNAKSNVTVTLDRSYVSTRTYDKVEREFYTHTGTDGDFVTAIITVSGENLPELDTLSDLSQYEEIEFINGNNTEVPNHTWKKNLNGSYSTSISFVQDGLCGIKVYVKNKYTPTFNEAGFGEKHNFVIDTQAPKFKIEYKNYTNHVNENEYYYGLTDGGVEENSKPTDIEVEITITEANVYKEDIEREGVIVVKKGKEEYKGKIIKDDVFNNNIKPDANNNSNNNPNTGVYRFTIPGSYEDESGQTVYNDGEFDIEVSYQDPINHSMVSSDNDLYPVNNGKYDGSERKDVIDTIRPEVRFKMSKYSKHYPNTELTKGADYYNNNFTADFEINDENFADSANEWSIDFKRWIEVTYAGACYDYQGTDGKKSQDCHLAYDEANCKYSYKADDNTKDGDFVFHFYGKDLAGNVFVVKKAEKEDNTTENDGLKEDKKLSSSIDRYESGVKILDRTRPVVTLTVTPTGTLGNDKFSTEYNRFFFNKSFEATFSIDELNYDRTLITPEYACEDVSDYTTGTPSAYSPFKESVTTDEHSFVFEEESCGKDGLYKFKITGEDRAGNKIILSTQEGSDTYINTKETTDDTLFSHIIVLDRIMPKLTVTMNDDSMQFYEAELLSEYNAEKNETESIYSIKTNRPYRKLTKATITFVEDDKSPTSLAYEMGSTNGGKNQYKYDSFVAYQKNREDKNATIELKQVYWFNSIKLTDLAGNVVQAPNPTNKIYLDETPPNNDLSHPEAKILVNNPNRVPQKDQKQPLYDNTVTLTVVVKDNIDESEDDYAIGKMKPSASGIYRVFYEVRVNGDKVNNNTERFPFVVNSKGGLRDSSNEFVSYKTKGPDTDLDPINIDESLTYEDTITFTFPSDKFNCNDISLRIWTEDNAGNSSTRENPANYYAFGIDVTSPTISVSYSNNDAQNGKYFKAPRTATVVVTERNFDASRTPINTQSGAHVSGWSYHNCGDWNGDGDTWTATVVYDADGDYTFGVSTTDLLGHGGGVNNWNNSVAPTEFTIDLTRPTINVSFDNNRVSNGRYYNANRRATIDINEHNFDTKDVTVERTASIAEGHVNVPGVGNWSRINDVNRTDVYFGQDGDYTMKVDYVDLAGNVAETYVVDTFTIDTVAPDLEIGGVEDKHAYNAKVAPSITYHDINYDKNSANISITGYNHPRGNNLDGVRSDERFGGSFICSNIDEVRDNDDIYTAKATISDLAGNTTEKEVTFSVNRFGSNYILSDSTKAYVDKYYNQDGEDLEITEINVNELSSYSVSYTKDGNLYNLAEDVEYSVEKSNPGWWQYDYHISDVKNFGDDSTNEGTYVVTLSSVDGASNKNSNRAVQETKTETNELPIEFIIDHTAPQVVFTGVEDNGKYRANERTIMIRYEDKSSFVDSLKIFNGDKLVEEYDAKQLSEKGGEIQFNAGASNNWQELKVEVTDAAGNMSPYESGRFLLTSNVLAQYLHSLPLVLATIGGVVLLIGVIIVILILRRRKRY